YVGGIRNDLRKVAALLGLPKLVFPGFGMCVGYPAQDPGLRPRLPLEAVLHRETYAPDDEAADAVRQYDETLRAYYVERTGGKRDTTWSQEMAAKFARPVRTDVRAFLTEQGFMAD